MNCWFIGDPGLWRLWFVLHWNEMSAVWNLWQRRTVRFGPSVCWRSRTPDGRLGMRGAGEQAQATLPAGWAARVQTSGKSSSQQKDKASGQGENGGGRQGAGSWAAGELGRSQPCSWPAGQNPCLLAWYPARSSRVFPLKVMRPSLQFRKTRDKKVLFWVIYFSWKAKQGIFQIFITTTKFRDLLTF